MLFRRREDREIGAITERIQAVMARQSGRDLCLAADSLKVPAMDLARFLDAPRADRDLLIDVMTALAYEAGVDPQWLLTGEYDGAVHRQVLTLGEDRSSQGRAAVREFVQQQYRRCRRDAMFAWWPGRRSAKHHRAQSADAARSA
jgi:hypothetical protein